MPKTITNKYLINPRKSSGKAHIMNGEFSHCMIENAYPDGAARLLIVSDYGNRVLCRNCQMLREQRYRRRVLRKALDNTDCQGKMEPPWIRAHSKEVG